MINNDFNSEFLEAVAKSDVQYMRNYIAATIMIDPTFSKAECDACMKYIEEHGLDITEPFVKDEVEILTPNDKKEWSKSLFRKKVEYLRRNFAYEERIRELREIGPIVYVDDCAEEAKTFPPAPPRRRSKAKKSSLPAMIGAIAAIAAIVAVIAVLLKK